MVMQLFAMNVFSQKFIFNAFVNMSANQMIWVEQAAIKQL